MSLGHHQNMTGEMRTLRVHSSLGPTPRLQLPLLRLLAAVAWQPALAAATRASPPNRDAASLPARPPHLAPAISAVGAGVHLRSSLSQLLMETPASEAAHMDGFGSQRKTLDGNINHSTPKLAPPSRPQNVSRKAEHNASLDHQSFAIEPGFVAAVRGARNSAGRRQEQNKSGSKNWPPPAQPTTTPPAPVEEPDPSGRTFFGIPKIMWAILLDIMAMLVFIACIPFILTIAKRRRLPSSQSEGVRNVGFSSGHGAH